MAETLECVYKVGGRAFWMFPSWSSCDVVEWWGRLSTTTWIFFAFRNSNLAYL